MKIDIRSVKNVLSWFIVVIPVLLLIFWEWLSTGSFIRLQTKHHDELLVDMTDRLVYIPTKPNIYLPPKGYSPYGKTVPSKTPISPKLNIPSNNPSPSYTSIPNNTPRPTLTDVPTPTPTQTPTISSTPTPTPLPTGIFYAAYSKYHTNLGFRVDTGFWPWVNSADRTKAKNVLLHYTTGMIHPISIERWAWQEKQKDHFKPSASFDSALDYAYKHNLWLYYYHLIWWHHSIQFNPDWLFPGNTDCSKYNSSQLKSIIDKHIKTVINYMQNKSHNHVVAWNVVNEAFMGSNGGFTPSCFYKVMGKQYIYEAFKSARKYDHNAMLVLNASFGRQAPNGTKADNIINFVKQAKQQGIPINAIGVQNHLAMSQITSKYFTNWHTFLNKAQSIGVKVVITEFDILDDASYVVINGHKYTQQDIYVKTVDMCLHDSTCVGVNFWGISDKYSWYRSGHPNSHPLLFDDTFQPKPIVVAIKNKLK